MRNRYLDICIHVQALRRYVEGIRTPLASATGVAAAVYTHQICNVHRVLTDIRVRHLLADEVGLGKTVQALMILNALKFQRTELRALIVVPDKLVTQWRDEIMTRAHTAPYDGSSDPEDSQYIRLAWPSIFGKQNTEMGARMSLSDIDSKLFDILVVDELHHLRKDIQDRIVNVSHRFQHLLILTATPEFIDSKRHAQLFDLLEPERARLARSEISDIQFNTASTKANCEGEKVEFESDIETQVVRKLISSEKCALANSDPKELPIVAQIHCSYRRMIRTRREDYPGVLPERKHISVIVDPLGAEIDRQKLMWRYFEYLAELDRNFNRVLLAKRAVLSPPSLMQRVDFLMRNGYERDNILGRVKPLTHQGKGDSRAEALLDLLTQIWNNNPCERILVASQDNLTVDYLYKLTLARLPEIGPLGSRVRLVAARVRQGMDTDDVYDVAGFNNETMKSIDMFQRGGAQILFAPDAAQVGLNLQCSRILILYSVPWKPKEVDQWIGRVDRIGNDAILSDSGNVSPVEVYTISQRGLIDERIISILKKFNVFEKCVNLDNDQVDRISEMIEEAALTPLKDSWGNVQRTVDDYTNVDSQGDFESGLFKNLPWNVDFALELRKRVGCIRPEIPALDRRPSINQGGPTAWDRTSDNMVILLRYADEYHIRTNTDPETKDKFFSLWYRFDKGGPLESRQVESKVVFSFGADPSHDRHPRHAFSFITDRRKIENPPRRSVTLRIGDEELDKPLNFLNFGNPLHDELVSGWLPEGKDSAMIGVEFPSDHEIWKKLKPSLYLLRLSILDPACRLISGEFTECSLKAIMRVIPHDADSDRIKIVLSTMRKMLQCMIEADVRWLRDQLCATVDLNTMRLTKEGWIHTNDEEVDALLSPHKFHNEQNSTLADIEFSPQDADSIRSEVSYQRKSDRNAAKLSWSHHFPIFKRSLSTRLRILECEKGDAVSVARSAVSRADSDLSIAMESDDQAAIARARKYKERVQDMLMATDELWKLRMQWLVDCGEGIGDTSPSEHMIAVIRPIIGK